MGIADKNLTPEQVARELISGVDKLSQQDMIVACDVILRLDAKVRALEAELAAVTKQRDEGRDQIRILDGGIAAVRSEAAACGKMLDSMRKAKADSDAQLKVALQELDARSPKVLIHKFDVESAVALAKAIQALPDVR